MDISLEERLYLLREMKECSEKNTAYLHTIPEVKRNRVSQSECSYSDVQDDALGENLIYLTKVIKLFIFKCVLCTMIFLGIYMCQKQNAPEVTEKIQTFSSALKKEEINNDLLQGKVDNTIQQILSKKTEEVK